MSTAYRGHARVFLKDLEAIRPSAIIDIIHSGESFVLEQSVQRGMKAMREFISAQHFFAIAEYKLTSYRDMSAVWVHVLK